ncbi:hypothetical protein [Flavobacterium sp.]|uniref:hypothetical protein n=1 Tax=Flavobacterium sp. TaxID=239 RepID=UPI0038FCBA92
MKLKFTAIFFIVFFIQSCRNDSEKQLIDTEKDFQKNELIVNNISKYWTFNASPSSSASKANAVKWTEWRLFLVELNQKPKASIRAFQNKAAELSKKVMALNENIPITIDKPQIKARIATLITKVRLLDLFIHLKNIPEPKVLVLVTQINEELTSLQNQMDKIVQKSKIPLEEGESDLIKMLDSSRAIPNEQPDPNIPRVE